VGMESVRVEKTAKPALLIVIVLLDMFVTGEGVKEYHPHQAVVLTVVVSLDIVVNLF